VTLIRPLAMRRLPAARVFGRAIGIGVVTGAALGALVGTCLLPLIGTVFGTLVGLFYGLWFGVANGVALAAVSRCRPGLGAAALTGGLVSGVVGVVAWSLLSPGSIATLPVAVFFAGLGAVLAPRAVAEPRPRRRLA